MPQHPAANTGSARRGIDIHPAQFHGIRRCPIKAEHANQAIEQGCDPKAAVVGAVGVDPINLIDQRALDIGFESVGQIGWAEQPVDFNEQLTDARTIGIPKWRISSSTPLTASVTPFDDGNTLLLLHLRNVPRLRGHPIQPCADTGIGSELKAALIGRVRVGVERNIGDCVAPGG